jgi:aromatic-L-amino-acid decarboxylase
MEPDSTAANALARAAGPYREAQTGADRAPAPDLCEMTESPRTTLDPAAWQGQREQGHRMLDDMFDYLETLRERPVWQPIPAATRAAFRAPLPQSGIALAEAHARFMDEVLPYAAGNAHPRFMGWVQGGGTAVGMLAEMLAAGLNANLGGRDQMPLEVERQIVHWMRELFGFPETASGVFVTGSSMANLIGLLVARTRALGIDSRRAGLAAGDGHRLTAYAATSAHGCVAQAMAIAGHGTQALRLVSVDAQHRMDIGELARRIADDRAAGLRPFFVVGTAGTVDVGAIDDLAAIADVARREQIWFHVDGALGGLGMMAPDLAPLLQGIERADSIALDFHKWGQVPYDAGFILVREGQDQLDAFVSAEAYLARHPRGLAAGSPWPCDLGPDLSRGFRALKTWFTVVAHGTDPLGAAMSQCCALARHLRQRVLACPALELLAPVALNIVCFRHRSADPDRDNAEIVADLHESGIAVPSTTTVGGHTAIRVAIVNHRTVASDVDALLEAVLRFGARRCRPPPQ